MKNFVKISLLACLFVGMSSFTSNTSEIENFEEDFGRCDDIAGGAYIVAQQAGASDQEAAQIWATTLLACVEVGGESDATATIE